VKRKYPKTLKAIFKKPTQAGIVWSDIEAFHRPHPQKEADKGAVIAMRKFLEIAEVDHDEV
jgi:hypothetical protein